MAVMKIQLIALGLLIFVSGTNAHRNMRNKKRETEIGPTCTQGGHNPLPPSGICPQSNDTYVFPGI